MISHEKICIIYTILQWNEKWNGKQLAKDWNSFNFYVDILKISTIKMKPPF